MILSNNYVQALESTTAKVRPSGLKNMQCVLFNNEYTKELHLPTGLDSAETVVRDVFADSGEMATQSVAQKYGGHQFGVWNPELGDGRGLLLGEVKDQQSKWIDLHLKGAGKTPFSRFADGRAVLRSTLREYVASEALHAIGIPSTRALCLINSQSSVYREGSESAAMMIRTAPSHVRFGHFEYYHYTEQIQILDDLMAFCLENHFSHCVKSSNPHYVFFETVVHSTARLIALWQAYGFVHGVMNTDNMSIHGITFDYGPFAFQDNFNARALFNHSDSQGRYSFDQQPNIGLWNCYALSEALSRFLSKEERQRVLDSYETVLLEEYQNCILKRLGIDVSAGITDSLWHSATPFLQTIANQSLDYNEAFIWLTQARAEQNIKPLTENLKDQSALVNWWQAYRELPKNPLSSTSKCNPLVIPRTQHLQRLISLAEKEEWQRVNHAVNALSHPYSLPDEPVAWLRNLPTAHSGTLTCSS